ncbi:MAG: class I SAM-dependent rRNA methyltransferase [Spirochaetaceae bacterium]|jgi:23S rRNA (cytosine1962-C5)-methyltransferase|nr:class I SAM-dependent rRNA methyltransferase [Spirochaetaceae bacterium]
MKHIVLKPGEQQRICAGHPWVYDNEVDAVLDHRRTALLQAGELADVESADRNYLGRAIVNPHSKILARIYSRSKEGLDKGFFKRRIRQSIARRSLYNLSCESARLVFGEADFLPGFIADRFVGWPRAALEASSIELPYTFEACVPALGLPQSWLALQFLSYGMDARRKEILEALEEVLAEGLGKPSGIIEKSAPKMREYEGLPSGEGLLQGSVPNEGIVIFENSFPLCVQLNEGQKTGFFLDQKENHRAIAPFVRGKSVLDLCCYSGAFGIHAGRFGAKEVLCVDLSKQALALAQDNARLNGLCITTMEADVFTALRSIHRQERCFDLIILDPPAFAKSHSTLDQALRGYKEINLQALLCLEKGGVLVSCSCSQALGEARFKRMIADAALDAGCRLHQIEFRSQASDHPILIGYDESFYLKCGIYQKQQP